MHPALFVFDPAGCGVACDQAVHCIEDWWEEAYHSLVETWASVVVAMQNTRLCWLCSPGGLTRQFVWWLIGPGLWLKSLGTVIDSE